MCRTAEIPGKRGGNEHASVLGTAGSPSGETPRGAIFPKLPIIWDHIFFLITKIIHLYLWLKIWKVHMNKQRKIQSMYFLIHGNPSSLPSPLCMSMVLLNCNLLNRALIQGMFISDCAIVAHVQRWLSDGDDPSVCRRAGKSYPFGPMTVICHTIPSSYHLPGHLCIKQGRALYLPSPQPVTQSPTLSSPFHLCCP